MQLSYDQTDDFSTGSLVTRVTNDITQMQNFIAQMIRMFIRSFGMFALGIVFTLSIDLRTSGKSKRTCGQASARIYFA